MRKGLKVLLGLFALAVVWLGLVLTEWLPRETALERESIAAVTAAHPNVAGHRNAFAALMLFDRDVPAAELEPAAAEDVKAFAEFLAHSPNAQPYEAPSAKKYAKLPEPTPADKAVLCENWKDDCLARVRANRDAIREKLARFGKLVEHNDALEGADFYHYEFVPRFDSPILSLGGWFPVERSRIALDFVDGKVDAAFDRLCRDTKTWRGLRAHGDVLIVDMVGVAQMSGAAQLYAQMLAEQPASFTPPCTDVFAPLTDAELDQCAVFSFEYASMSHTLGDSLEMAAISNDPDVKSAVIDTLFNKRHVLASSAVTFGQYCLPPQRERVHLRSIDPRPTTAAIRCGAVAKVFDPFGCEFTEVATPDYDDYYIRVLDLDGRMKLLQSALWLRAQPAGGDQRARFEARPDALKSAAHPMTLDPEKGVLSLVPIDKHKGATWDIPLAPR